jgi:signal transduction histidine kinase
MMRSGCGRSGLGGSKGLTGMPPAIWRTQEKPIAVEPDRLSAAQEPATAVAEPLEDAVRRERDARDRQLSVVMHELRTPISSIKLNLELLERTAHQRGTLDAAEVARFLTVPRRQLTRLARMVDRLLDLAQVESDRLVLHPERLDLCDLVQDTAERIGAEAAQAGAELRLVLDRPVEGIWDRLRLEQVTTNLLANAVKYGSPSLVTVSVRRHDDGQAELTVTDEGDGIAEVDHQRIFEPFERAANGLQRDGAGLGLYIVRQIVAAHGGMVRLVSHPGDGASFSVILPAGIGES